MNKLLLLILVAFTAFTLASCESVIDDDNDPNHYIMKGFGMYDSSNEMILQVLNDNFVEGSVEHITVADGSELKNFKVRFFDSLGNEITKPTASYQPLFDVNNADIARVTLDDNQSMQYTITGLKEGATKMRFKVMHGSHFDYTSPEIQIVVN